MIDIRDHVAALHARAMMSERLVGRPDIIGFAGMLIGYQDAYRLGLKPTLPDAAPLQALPTADELAALLVCHIEFTPDGSDDCGPALPGGVRHPLLHWSPILQFARLRSPDGRVCGRRVTALPDDPQSLERWLAASCGMPPPRGRAATGDEIAVRAAFEHRFRFSLAELAAWLLDIRSRDPVSFLLLLSREFPLAIERMPELNSSETHTHGTRRFLKRFAYRQIIPVLIVAELQRLLALMRDLHRHGAATGTLLVRSVVQAPRAPLMAKGRRISAAIVNDTGIGKAIDASPLHAEAIRRLLALRDRPPGELDADAIYSALAEDRTDWDNSRSALTPEGAAELIATMLAPDIMAPPKGGRGHRQQDRPLDIYYGVDAYTLAYLAILELSFPTNNSKSPAHCALLAIRMLDAAKGVSAVHTQSQVARHKRAVEVVGLYLLRYPHFGSAGRFVASAWLDRYRDLPLFRILIQPADLGKAAATTREREWLFAVAMTVLRERFAGLYADLSALPEALEITCDLATSASVLTCDPILHSILLRANAEALAVRSEAAQRRRNQSTRPDTSAANGDHGNLNAAIPPAMAMHQIEHALDRAVRRTRGRRDDTGAP